MGIYWQISGTEAIAGNATEANHIGWIRCNSMGFGSGRNVITRTGRAADREVSTGHVSEITLSKDMDLASVNLFMASCLGSGTDMTIHVTRAGARADAAEITYLKYELENCMVSGYSLGGSSTGNPTETITINFTKIQMIFSTASSAARGLAGVPVTFDMATGSGSGA
jgi:type VI secretion system secreted protein Hcp